jgi:hypothetical protein
MVRIRLGQIVQSIVAEFNEIRAPRPRSSVPLLRCKIASGMAPTGIGMQRIAAATGSIPGRASFQPSRVV